MNYDQRWKKDPSLFGCQTFKDGHQERKVLDYYNTYVQEFLNCDPLRDWESIDRCKALWFFALRTIGIEPTEVKDWAVLDCGTKDGQFVEFLDGMVRGVVGTEVSSDYVEYAQNKGRNVIFSDVCDMDEDWTDKYDIVFSHHLLGLVPDYYLGLQEMYRVLKPGGYMITCNDVPGNPRKHYSLIHNEQIFTDFGVDKSASIIYNDRWNEALESEWVFLIQKPIKKKRGRPKKNVK